VRGRNKIRWYLAVKNLAIKELAARAGISYAELNRIMKNKVSPRFNTMLLIAKALDENVWNVFFDEQNSKYKELGKTKEGGIRLQNKIRDLLEKKGMTIAELSESAGVSRVQLLKIIRNEVSPVFETMLIIADAFNENVRDVFY